MNTVFFGAKRAFLSSVALTRRRLRAIAPGMTAARYDMMFVIAHRPRREEQFWAPWPAVRQARVREALGVSAAVVSRMLRSLVELGWVQSTCPCGDRRQRCLQLTAEGRKQMQAAFRQVASFAKRFLQRVLYGDRHGSVAAYRVMVETQRVLGRLRAACGDTANLWRSLPSPDG